MWFPRNKAPWPIAFASKSLTSTETWYSNIEREALCILNGLEKVHHYHFTCKVIVITDHKPVVAILREYVASLSWRLHRILPCMHQYHHKNTVQTQIKTVHSGLAVQIQLGMNIPINAIESCMDIPHCMTLEEIRSVTIDYKHLSMLSDNVFHVSPTMKAEIQKRSTAALIIQTWNCNNWLNHHER